MSELRRPALRYHGGKWRLAPWIIAHFPAHRIYVEPFGGAASVLLRKPRSCAEVYNDLDGEVVGLFRVLRDPAAAARLAEMVKLTPFSREEYDSAHESADDPVEQARRTLVKAWMGFGSGALVESSAGFRVSLTERRHTPLEWSQFGLVIPAFATRLEGVLIEHRPAVDIIARHDAPDALHYIDPPYVGEVRGARHRYRHEMDASGHVALAAQLNALGGMVVLSGYDSPQYADLYRSWETRRRPSRDAHGNERTEVLWLNPACAAALDAETDFDLSAHSRQGHTRRSA